MTSNRVDPTRHITRLLLDGDRRAAFELLYPELRRLARRRMKGERAGHTLQPTALVNELFIRFAEEERLEYQDRSHLMAVAARIMRRILIDYARERLAKKRGGDVPHVPIGDAFDVESPQDAEMLIALDEALDKFGEVNERARDVVVLRYYGGLTIKEIAGVLKVSPRTVDLDWHAARVWLHAGLP